MPLKKTNLRFLVFALLLAVFAAADNLFCLTISGEIRDKSNSTEGLLLSNVTVTLTGASTRTYITSSSGYYGFTGLLPGRYTVTPSSAVRIFQPGNRIFNIVSGDQTNQDFSGSEYVYILKWGTYGITYGQFGQPSGIAVSSLSCVYAADTGNHRIQRFSSSGAGVTGTETDKWGLEDTGGNPIPSASDTEVEFNQPFDVAVDSVGLVYVADTFNNRILKFDPEGVLDIQISSAVYLPDATTTFFTRPRGICSDNSEGREYNFYVADTDNNRILQLSSTGVYINEWGSSGAGDGQFNHPGDVAVDSAGNIYVADTFNNRIQKFDYPGNLKKNWGSAGTTGDGKFTQPNSIAVDNNDNIYVTDTGNKRIQVFTSDGIFITKWGYQGTDSGKFEAPYGIAVGPAPDNAVYVSDRGSGANNHRIQKFAPASSFVNISGNVIFSTSGMTDVSLTLQCSEVPGVVISTTFVTGPDGYYEFVNLPIKGEYTVTLSSFGYVFNPSSLTVSSIAGSIYDWNFEGISNIQGYIRDKYSVGLSTSGVEVTLSGPSISSVTTTTDENGFYQFQSLPVGGHYTVTPTEVRPTDPTGGIGFYPISITTSSLPHSLNWDFESFPFTSIKGYVADSYSDPIIGVAMNLSGTNLYGTVSTTTYTDSDGNYEFLNLPIKSSYTVTPYSSEHSFPPPGSRTIGSIEPAITDWDFVGAPNYIKGCITGKYSPVTPVDAAAVYLSGSSSGVFTTNGQGNYEIRPMRIGGNYTVTPTPTAATGDIGFDPSSRTISSFSGNINNWDFLSFDIFSISGTVKDRRIGGSGVPGVTLYLTTGAVVTSTTTGSDGCYEFTGLPVSGNYTVTPSSPGYSFTPVSMTTAAIAASITDWDFVRISDSKVSIEGHVTEKYSAPPGLPVAGAAVNLSGAVSTTTYTDSDGFYLFELLSKGGNYTVTLASTDGFGFSPSSRTVTSLSVSTTGWNFSSFPLTSIKGNVTDSNSNPIGAAMNLSGTNVYGTVSTTAYTDSGGDYEFLNLPINGNYTVAPSSSDYSFTPSSRIVSSITEAIENWNFEGALYYIQGIITEKYSPSTPVSDVVVYLSGFSTGSVIPDENGLYRFESMHMSGNYTVTPSSPAGAIGFAPSSITVPSFSGNIDNWNFSSFDVFSISGTVKETGGSGISGVMIQLAVGGSQLAVTTTTSNGRYEFTGLPVNSSCTVAPVPSGYSFIPSSFTTGAITESINGWDFIRISISSVSLYIEGYITEKYPPFAPVPDVVVYLSGSSTGSYTTASTGLYLFDSLFVGGQYTVTPAYPAGAIGFEPPSRSTASLLGNATGQNFLSFAVFSISGTVKDNETGGIPYVTLNLTGDKIASTVTGTAGNYEFLNLPVKGSYTVTPSSTGYSFTPVSLATGSIEQAIEDWDFIGNSDFISIKGFVKYDDGSVAPGVTLNLTGANVKSTTADSDGKYEFTGLPIHGNYTVTPSKPGYVFNRENWDFQDLKLPVTAADFIALTRHDLNITGYVKKEGGVAVNSVVVSLYVYGGSTTTVVTDNSGSFRFSGLTGRKNYTLTPSKLNWIFTPVSSATYLDAVDANVDFTASFTYNESPPNIEIPLGRDGNSVQVKMPDAGAAKVIVEERPEKAAKYRGTVNPDKNEAVGILFKPSVPSADYVNRKFTIRIFSVKGELVYEFSKTPLTPDDIWVKWIPKNLASGIYIIHIEGPGVKSTKKIAILK